MKLMMLGETTGNKRSEKEYEFLGTNAERFIWVELEKYGLSRNDFHTFSVFKDLGHKHTNLSEDEVLERQISLQKEILMVEPDLVLSVGRHPTEELLQEKLGGRFYESIGELLYSTEYNVWFIATVHPTIVARDKEKLPILQTTIEKFFESYRGLLENEYDNRRPFESNAQYI